MRNQFLILSRVVSGILLASLAACGGSGSSDMASNGSSTTASGTVPLTISDASSEDWATIGVKIKNIALVPQGGGSPVTVYSATTAPMLNLAELDQISEILGNVSIPVGTYSAAILTISANPGDVALTVAADPETGFAGTAGAIIPANQIQIQHAQGTAGSLTTAITVNLVTPLVVTTGQNNALDLEFDLAHPAFIVGHVPVISAGSPVWAVNFNGPIRHHPVRDITRLVLRHSYGLVTGVATDNTSITMTKELPAYPITTPETAVDTTASLQILADATNGSLYYDVDAKSGPVTLRDFSAVSGALKSKYVRIAARYQQNGMLVATRIWSSSDFNSLWLSPEGHVLHVDTANNIINVASETGRSVPLKVDANTQFYFRAPDSMLADTTPIGTGTSFLSSHNLVRGFKVHASVVDPLAATLVAQSIDIETAVYDGKISNANSVGFTYTRRFATALDNYNVTLPYIDNTTANGKDSNGNAITGFKWWNFAFPTVVDSGTNAISDFVSATNGGVNFGGTFGSVNAWGTSTARWGDIANATGWSVKQTILLPTPLPLGSVATAIANSAFTMTIPSGGQAATIAFSTTSGSATLVYQVDRSGGVVSVSPVDITTAAGLNTFTQNLQAGSLVKVYGVPQSDGTFKAYVVSYYTGNVATTM